ncbi:GTP binding protein [Flagelloscypha sp. PMI_526]|nr:GTP binding protein [Flagelloscypha sp. PMI_526]
MQAPRRSSSSSAQGTGFQKRKLPEAGVQELVSCSKSTYIISIFTHPSGKTSFLRLLLDTCDFAPNAPNSQLSSLVDFIEASNRPTTSIRHVTVDLLGDLDGTERPQHFELTLIDTPPILVSEANTSQRILVDLLNLVDGRLADGLDELRRPYASSRFITLCVYFLDPDAVVLSSLSQGRTAASSSREKPSIVLEQLHVHAIRQLAERVNVLPVIAKADTLTMERLAALKQAAAGIGFGIFDRYRPGQPSFSPIGQPTRKDASLQPHSPLDNDASGTLPGPTSMSPPAAPDMPSIAGMPYTLISPDAFAHSDGVSRSPLSRADLMQSYASSSRTRRSTGFTRTYRWGHLDVLDSNHCDFSLLKYAVFRHFQTLHDYTETYLFEKFRKHHFDQLQPPLSRTSPSQHRDTLGRPVLAINTSSSSAQKGPPSTTNEKRQPLPIRPPETHPSGLASGGTPVASPKYQRSRKITVACQVSRKLKCDGAKPSCSQCTKRSHACDYMYVRKSSKRKDGEAGSESGDSGQEAKSESSHSPTTSSRPASRQHRPRLPSISHAPDGAPSLPPLRPPERYEEPANRGLAASRPLTNSYPQLANRYPDTELPHIATLSLPELSPTTPVPPSAASLPPLRPPVDLNSSSLIRKRSSTVPGNTDSVGRLPGSTGPKIIACNFCRARKTKCDGSQPCQQCAKRSLPCNYVQDSGRRGPRRASAASTTKSTVESSPKSTISSKIPPTPVSAVEELPQEARIHRPDDDELASPRPVKRMKLLDSPTSHTPVPIQAP